MIIEGICTTLDANGSVNLAPMGPVVDPELTTFVFRPFQSSTTFHNLQQTRAGVFHVVDDVLLIARLVTNTLTEIPAMFPAAKVAGSVLAGACRWYEFEVLSIDATRERAEIQTRIVHVGRLKDFWGFNRARHAVLEAAILVTRLHLLPPLEVEQQFRALRSPVEKTASDAEREAFELLDRYAGLHL